MEGKIVYTGYLEIKRANRFVKQECPFVNQETQNGGYCGDWCPHFGEPKTKQGVWKGSEIISNDGALLDICHDKTLVFNKFTDERGE